MNNNALVTDILGDKKKICIVGAGGFGRETLLCIIDAIAATDLKIEEVACFMVEEQYLVKDKIMGVDVLSQSNFDPEKYKVVVAIGDPKTRK